MSLISVFNLSKSYEPVDIFSGVSFSIPKGGRIAIVGPNGVGKTTLLRILVGLEEPSNGKVQRARGLRLGYLPQEALIERDLESSFHSLGSHSVWEECLGTFHQLLDMEQELNQLEEQLSNAKDDLLQRYGNLQAAFEHAGGYIYEMRIRQTLTGLGFETSDFHRPIPQLSGGQRTRLMLARLLLSNPDLLVLDEPTNHLDIQAVEWLEGYLREWEGATLIVSHDRYFMDRVVDHVWEMHKHGLELYRGNYSAYVMTREQRWELREQIFETEMGRLLKELDYIKKNITGQNVSQARGRLRRLSREVQAIEQLGFEAVSGKQWLAISDQAAINEHTMGVEEIELRIKALRNPRKRPPHLHLNLKASNRSGDLVLRTQDLEVGYADEGKPLFTAPDLLLKRGDCAAVIGPNGAGKTTFLKTLLSQIPPLRGDIFLGASLHLGYFAQAHEGLNPENTLVQEIDALAPHMLLGEIRDYLAKFLFRGEDVFQKVSTLSGGERGRLALAKLGLTKANLLLLDEPTNHLDIPSQETLQEVLVDYTGTILLVSHDRYLIDALGTQIWEIDPSQSTLNVFEGTYSLYREFQDKQRLADSVRKRQVVTPQKAHLVRVSSEDRKRKSRLKEVEGLISTLEAQLDELSHRLENPPADSAKVHKWGNEYVRLQQDLDELLKEWEELVV
jgi:ATP-binding cassette subfamily F protein 3